jgi:cytochrome c
MRTRVAALCILLLVTCCCERFSNQGSYAQASRITGGGNPAIGKELIRRYGCQGCHTIPSIKDARGTVGPPLEHLSQRVYLAGELPNTAENLMRWIQHPHQVHPHTAMPEMGVTDQDARDISAFLYAMK